MHIKEDFIALHENFSNIYAIQVLQSFPFRSCPQKMFGQMP